MKRFVMAAFFALAACDVSQTNEAEAPLVEDLMVNDIAGMNEPGAQERRDNIIATSEKVQADAAERDRQSGSGAGAARPSFDTTAYCEEVSGAVGGSYVIERTCREQEAEARTQAAAMSIPARVASYCEQVANAASTRGGSYVIYKTCVEQELAAAAEL